MSIFGRLFGFTRKPEPPPPPSSRPHSHLATTSVHPSATSSGSQSTQRRELLRVVLRDTLQRHGIPTAWVEGEMLVATSRKHEPSMHWRLVVKHWDSRLMTHGVAFQHSLIKRLTTFDPMAGSWLTGMSWQFALPDESLCPPMPHPGSWTADPHDPVVAAAKAVPSADVIAGPVRIVEPALAEADEAVASAAQTRADLEALMALREDDFKRHSQDEEDDPSHQATQPMYLSTEPARL